MENDAAVAMPALPPTALDATPILAPTRTAAPTPPEPEPPSADLLYRFSVQQYHEMIQAEILGEDDPVELLDGWLVRKMPKHSPHTTSTLLTTDRLKALVPEGWHVRSQEPVTLAESEPEPDVMIVRGGVRDYMGRQPGPDDVALVVEVADSSLQRDRTWKMRLYADANIPVYWIVNLVDGRVEAHSEPESETGTYRVVTLHLAAEMVPLLIDGEMVADVAVADLLP